MCSAMCQVWMRHDQEESITHVAFIHASSCGVEDPQVFQPKIDPYREKGGMQDSPSWPSAIVTAAAT